MATRLLYQTLTQIPGEQRPPVAALIFMLCFASFATVLALGGGPQATTIELAIYQALSYDYDPGRAALLALIQMGCCLSLILLSQRLSKAIPVGATLARGWRNPEDSWRSKLTDSALIGAALLLLLPPLLALLVDGLRGDINHVLADPALWRALWTSLRIALCAGGLCVILTMMLLWSTRELYLRQRRLAGQSLELCGVLILAMPGIVLATGFFLLLNATIGLPERADAIVIFTNALMAIPYALKVLDNPMRDIAARYRLSLILLSQRLSKAIPVGATLARGWRNPEDSWRSKLTDSALIGAALLLLLPPLLALLVDGLRGDINHVLADPALWRAL
ncbi:Thiamin ABC transporter, transmembrane component [Cronobacter sakazakii 696]|nr:Thiamin ABC transporter, transmembrane component [Cronobacter sakazakii 696]